MSTHNTEAESSRVRLGDIAEVFGGRTRRRTKEPAKGPLVPVVNLNHMGWGGLPPVQELDEINLNDETELDRYALRTGDVLMTARSPQLKANYVPNNFGSAIAGANLIVIRPHDCNFGRTLQAFFLSPQGQAELLIRNRTATLAFALSVRDLKRMEVPEPPPSTQNLLAELMEAAEDQHRIRNYLAELHSEAVDTALHSLFNPWL